MSAEEVKPALDAFHWHEALDRCFLVQEIIQTVLLDHPVFKQHEQLAEKVAQAQSLIGQVYQDIGSRKEA